jgi:hypothetical protein
MDLILQGHEHVTAAAAQQRYRALRKQYAEAE